MIRSKFVSWLACAAGLAIPIAGFAQNKPKIVVVTHGQVSDPFWNVVHQGVLQAAKDADCTADYRAPEKFDMVSLSQAIDAAVASKPDGAGCYHSGPRGVKPIDSESGRRWTSSYRNKLRTRRFKEAQNQNLRWSGAARCLEKSGRGIQKDGSEKNRLSQSGSRKYRSG